MRRRRRRVSATKTSAAIVVAPKIEKEVEFKTYATFALPHARVVAIDADLGGVLERGR